MLSSIIGPISSLAGTWLQGRVDKAKAETEVKVACSKKPNAFSFSFSTEDLSVKKFAEFLSLIYSIPI